MENTLLWNGKRSEDMGIKIISLPPIQLSTPRITEIEIQGRDGSLSEFNGYASDTKAVQADYVGNDPLKIVNWLKGSGEVTFGNLPDRYYKARINNIIPISEVIKNHLHNFPIEFRCQPFGYLVDGKETLTLTGPTTLNNSKATHVSKPIITIRGTGACTFTINSRTFNISEMGGSITIDSDIEEVYNGKGDKMSGEFPYLDIGENNISYTGNITSFDITPFWRCL